MKTATKVRLPRLARILKSYLKLFDAGSLAVPFMERSRLKGKRLGQMRAELDRMTARRGSTLMEVMMSLLILMLGVVPLISLFVLSSARGAIATQKTAAADLRMNAETAIELYHHQIIDAPLSSSSPFAVFDRPFTFDPLGAALASGSSVGRFGVHRRYSGSWLTESTAAALVTSPDNWITVADGFVTKFAPGTLIPGSNPPQYTPSSIDFPEAATATLPPAISSRLSMFNSSMTAVQTRSPILLSGTTVTWADMLPDSFVPQRAKIEIQDRRYTWMLTVRPTPGVPASTDVVVFFKRSFDPVEEIQVPAMFTLGSTSATVTTTIDRVRRGAFVFDSENALWYRIANFRDNGKGTILLNLETPATVSSPSVGGSALLLRGIVDVFPIGKK